MSKHLNVLHTARQAFVKAESSERIRQVLRYKIRANSEKYESGRIKCSMKGRILISGKALDL